MYLEGLARAARERPDLELVGQSTDGREALEELRRLEPCVALIDMRMPSLNGSELLLAAKRDGIETRIVMLSAYGEADLVYTAIADGAAGYLSKEADRRTIFDAVAAAARGEVVLSPEFQVGLVAEIQRRESAERPLLSAREQEVLRLTADGLSGPDIARQLHLSPTTVKSYLQNVYEKLGVSDRAAAVAAAMRRGLLD
jgi:two-component system nitrate/nitrite response regulator NarL